MTGRVVVLGVGNVILGDDGLGVRCVERLAAAGVLPPGVVAIDGGTSSHELIGEVEGAELLVIVDAVAGASAPGESARGERAPGGSAPGASAPGASARGGSAPGGSAPGEIIRIDGDRLAAAFSQRLSPHQHGIRDLLATLELLGRAPARVVVLGMVPARIDLGLELSPEIEAALPALAARVVAEVS